MIKSDFMKLTRGESLPLVQGKTKSESDENFTFPTLKILAVLCFVFFGAAQTIAMKASGGSKGTLAYDTSAAVTICEATKLTIAVAWTLWADRSALVWPLPAQWKVEIRGLAVVAVLYTIANMMNFLAAARLGATVYSLLSNLKIVSSCIFMVMLMKKQFSALQLLAVALLTFSGMSVSLPSGPAATSAASFLSVPSTLGLAYSLISSLCSGLAAVQNEVILKSKGVSGEEPMPFMMKNAFLYFFSVLISLGSWFSWGEHPLSACLHGAALASILLLVCLGLTTALMLRYLDNMYRCFSCVSMVLVVVIVSQALFHEIPPGLPLASALCLFATAVVLYQMHDSPNLTSNVACALVLAMMTFGVTVYIDTWTKMHPLL
eukprot:TRINITY_DN46670_c0_g1_i1.p1 TRINITY_DN46670_c0_g1~~TRINITY_DN46670_c0_g1_i1.p1  ORF type:complete len:377 (+),score=59.36 TRINITY_DN46670_c0_g1_i1:78-1208(+)